MALRIDRVDYADTKDARDMMAMMDAYARDPMGGSAPLEAAVMAELPERLASVPQAFSLLARADDEAIGLANCFFGFSTFKARPLVNVHDVIVSRDWRGRGVARALFDEIEAVARSADACKVTLEVLSGNERAKAFYASIGFGDYALDPSTGTALFWQKRLES